jgi:hypothetical protein
MNPIYHNLDITTSPSMGELTDFREKLCTSQIRTWIATGSYICREIICIDKGKGKVTPVLN